MEISPGLHAVQLLGAQGHVFFEDTLTVVDTGLPGSGRLLERYLRRRRRSLEDVRRVVCTHGHPDHAGGARELARDGVTIHMHPADYANLDIDLPAALRHPSMGSFFAAATPKPPDVVPLRDGEVLPVAGGLEVIHTPGHTPGSVCFFERSAGLLFTGDLFQRRGDRIVFASWLYSDDVQAARRAVQRLGDLDVSMIVFSHYPPMRDGARETLRRLVRASERM